MEIPAQYRGREQALIKHQLLETYLYKLFMIVGQHHPTISYVDCFAGPWQEASEDMSDTSIGRSLSTMKNCLVTLQNMGHNVRFRALFVEKDATAYQRLREYLDLLDTPVETESFHGKFYNVRHKILDWCGPTGFTFFFVDPLGWKSIVEVPTLEPFLQRPDSEFLINFMFDFILRAHGIPLHEKDMIAIFGQVPQTDGITSDEKEPYLVELYRNNLKRVQPMRGGKPRSVTVPIQRPDKDRTLYHLVYLTRHPLGIVKFMEASEHLDFVQKAVRIQAKHDKKIETTGQGELFGALENIKVDQGHIPISVIKDYWLGQLTSLPQLFGIDKLADMLEDTGWFESNFQEAFHELQKEGMVINLDDAEKSKRRKKFVHFDANHNSGERLAKVRP
jgi:three-Cys-motif partner protein